MKGFGEMLREARLAKGIELEIAARDTNISQRYIEALETEKLALFPGEPYLIGFLRNYSEYLEADADELIHIYRKVKIQQAEVPESLLIPKKKLPLLPIIAGVLLLGVGVFFLVRFITIQNKKKVEAAKTAAVAEQPAAYLLAGEPLQVKLRKGDIIQVPVDDKVLELKVVNTLSFLTLETPVGPQIVDLGDELGLDIDGKPGSELSVYVQDISTKDASRGADVRILLTNVTAAAQKPAETGLEDPVVTPADAVQRLVALESPTAYPFTLNATFRGACVFRYQVDRQSPVESLYANGEMLVTQANNGIRVWFSNANAVKMQIIAGGKTVDIEVGRPGQVMVNDIKWVKDNDGRFRLVVFAVE